jgi:UDP-2,4-diacetamido-2,4,6-trideoxy-beta-L-altropyranose hydrolase
MRVLIRADASFAIGTGHVMRCVTLAGYLRAKGSNVAFVCREEDGHLCGLIEGMQFQCMRLPKFTEREIGTSAAGAATDIGSFGEIDARQTRAAIEASGSRPDLLVVDHYGLDKAWEVALRPLVGRIFVIDDLANRAHDCDLLLDQNLHDMPNSRYAGLVPATTRVFVGPRYALLRPEFSAVAAAPRTGGLRRMLVFFGGVDPTNEALKIVQAVHLMGSAAPETDLVLGPANPHLESVVSAAGGLACLNILGQTDDMAGLMRKADLGIGTCGVAAWERCSVGLPSLVVVSADNQRDDARILQTLGAARNLGEAVNTSVERWAAEVRAMQENAALLTAMSIAAASIMQDRYVAMRDLETALDQ